MKSFVFGLVVGVMFTLPVGVNIGKGVPVFSDPFAEKPLSQQVTDTARSATDRLKQKTGELIEDTRQVIQQASE
jgi:hypothetical protein